MSKYRLLESPSGNQWTIEEEKNFKWVPVPYWQDESKYPEDHECLETVSVRKIVYLNKNEAKRTFDILIDNTGPWVVVEEG